MRFQDAKAEWPKESLYCNICQELLNLNMLRYDHYYLEWPTYTDESKIKDAVDQYQESKEYKQTLY